MGEIIAVFVVLAFILLSIYSVIIRGIKEERSRFKETDGFVADSTIRYDQKPFIIRYIKEITIVLMTALIIGLYFSAVDFALFMIIVVGYSLCIGILSYRLNFNYSKEVSFSKDELLVTHFNADKIYRIRWKDIKDVSYLTRSEIIQLGCHQLGSFYIINVSLFHFEDAMGIMDKIAEYTNENEVTFDVLFH